MSVNKSSGFTEFKPYDIDAAKKQSKENSKKKKGEKDGAADGVKAGTEIGGGIVSAAGYGEVGTAIQTGGKYTSTAIKAESGIQYASETGDTSAALSATLTATQEANAAYQAESKGEGGLSDKSRANANTKQATHANEQASSLEGKVTKAKEENPDIVGKDGSIDTSTSEGKRAYRQAARADNLRAKEKTYTARAGDLDARSKPSTKSEPKSTGGAGGGKSGGSAAKNA